MTYEDQQGLRSEIDRVQGLARIAWKRWIAEPSEINAGAMNALSSHREYLRRLLRSGFSRAA